MTIKSYAIFAGALFGFAAATATVPAQALTMQECSAKYEAAKKDGSLGTKKWNDFRKSDCSADAKPAATAAPAPAPVAPPKAEAKAAPAPKPAAAPVASGPVAFPTAVSPKYSSESAGKARMHTCLDQYNANKAGSGNGDLKWIQKGGGYYSQCNAKLKG
ncbi:MAG: hypothetical protein HY242_10925 [Afipia sp.]|nr:hypothetical protein [Afipia sp.]